MSARTRIREIKKALIASGYKPGPIKTHEKGAYFMELKTEWKTGVDIVISPEGDAIESMFTNEKSKDFAKRFAEALGISYRDY